MIESPSPQGGGLLRYWGLRADKGMARGQGRKSAIPTPSRPIGRRSCDVVRGRLGWTRDRRIKRSFSWQLRRRPTGRRWQARFGVRVAVGRDRLRGAKVAVPRAIAGLPLGMALCDAAEREVRVKWQVGLIAPRRANTQRNIPLPIDSLSSPCY